MKFSFIRRPRRTQGEDTTPPPPPASISQSEEKPYVIGDVSIRITEGRRITLNASGGDPENYEKIFRMIASAWDGRYCSEISFRKNNAAINLDNRNSGESNPLPPLTQEIIQNTCKKYADLCPTADALNTYLRLLATGANEVKELRMEPQKAREAAPYADAAIAFSQLLDRPLESSDREALISYMISPREQTLP